MSNGDNQYILNARQQLDVARQEAQQKARQPTVSELMQRGMQGRIEAQTQEQQQRIQTAQRLSQISEAEKQLGEAEFQMKTNSPEFYESAWQEAERNIRLGVPVSFYSGSRADRAEDAMRRQVKSYMYDIQKGLPKTYVIKDGEIYKAIEQPAMASEIPTTPTYSSRFQPEVREMQSRAYLAATPSAIKDVTFKQVQIPVQIQKSIPTMVGESILGSRVYPVAKKVVAKGGELYSKTETLVSKETQAGRGVTPLFPEMKPYEEAIKQKYPFPANLIKPPKAAYEFIRGEVTELREKPVKALAITGAWTLGSAALGYAGRGIGAVGKATGVSAALTSTKAVPLPSFFMAKVSPKMLWETTKTVGVLAAGTYYGKSIAKRIQTVPLGERTYAFGRIMAGEVQPMIAGSILGTLLPQEIEGRIRTFGRTEIPSKALIPSDVDVVGGRNRFPTAPVKEHMKLFQTQSQRIPGYNEPMMYHQTGEQFWKSGQGFQVEYTPPMETSEFWGLFGSYGVSPHFLRVGGQNYDLIGTDLISSMPKPASAAIIPKRFVKGITAAPGEAFVPGTIIGKTEVQAIMPLKSAAVPISQEYFYTLQGTRIPLDIFRGEAAAGLSKTAAKSFVVAPSSSAAKSSLISPLEFAFAPSVYKSSKPSSSMVSSKVSYSFTAPSESSIISSATPSSYLSPVSMKSYEPSSISYTPSIPSYNFLPSYSAPPSPPSMTPPSYTPPPSPPSSSSWRYNLYGLSSGISKPKLTGGKKSVAGYKVLFKRFGKYRAMEGIFPRYKAIRLGESRAMHTLARTFKIEKQKGEIIDISPMEYTPSERVFRSYKIQKGRKISLKDEWIQRRKYSLGTFGERKEIQSARRAKRSILKW